MSNFTEHETELLHAIADKKAIQYRTNEGKWLLISSNALLSAIISGEDISRYRVARETIVIGEFVISKPATKPLERGTTYFVVDLDNPNGYHESEWYGDDGDLFRLRMGLIHLEPKDAGDHAKALFFFTSNLK